MGMGVEPLSVTGWGKKNEAEGLFVTNSNRVTETGTVSRADKSLKGGATW